MLCCGKSKKPFSCEVELLNGTHANYSKNQNVKVRNRSLFVSTLRPSSNLPKIGGFKSCNKPDADRLLSLIIYQYKLITIQLVIVVIYV